MGKTKEQNKCKNRAKYLVPWAGKQLKCCEGHARGISALGNVIGSPIQVVRIAMLDMCEMNDDLPKELKGIEKD